MLRSRVPAVLILACGGAALAWAPDWAPAVVLMALATTVVPLVETWRGSRGTALRAAVAWAGLALALALVSQAVGSREPLAGGRPVCGHVVYLSVLASFAALVSVLNARTPGGAAWALLMALLVLVFLIPWLEGPAMARKAHGLNRLRLDFPWTVFYVLVVVAGITNYLPTRYGPAAAWLGLGLVCEYVALTRSELRLALGGRLWPVFPWTLAVAAWTARFRAERAATSRRGGLEATWLWFRDHWGVVWALRVEERFNRTAQSSGWPFRLGWYGLAPAPGTLESAAEAVPPAAPATLRGLLRRFAEPWRIEAAARQPAPDPCVPPHRG